MSSHIVSGILGRALANGDSLTLAYPQGTDVTRFVQSTGHKAVLGQNEVSFDAGQINVVFNASTLVFTNRTGKTIPMGTSWQLQLEERDRADGTITTKTSNGSVVEVKTGLGVALSAGKLVGTSGGSCAQLGIERKSYPLARSDNHRLAARGASDSETETNLRAAYAAAKLLRPGGNALATNNRAFVLIPRGTITLTDELVLDTNYVDLIAESPENPVGSNKVPLDTDWVVEADGHSMEFFRPTGTILQGNGDFSILRQSVSDVRLMGFTVANLRPAGNDSPEVDYSALLLPENATGNVASHYQDMLFFAVALRWQNSDNTGDNLGVTKETGSVTSRGGIQGTWVDCVSSGPSFRTRNQNATFSGKFLRVYAGAYSWNNKNPQGFDGAIFIDCHARGAIEIAPNPSVSGQNAFGETSPVSRTCLFVGCTAGNNSFGSNTDGTEPLLNSGTFVDCKGGNFCFGGIYFDVSSGTGNGGYSTVEFHGTAINCIAGDYSFGGGNGYLSAIPATFSRTTTTATVTSALHGLSSNDKIMVLATNSNGAIVTGTKTVTVSDPNTFTFTCLNTGAASGDILYRNETTTDGVGTFTGTLVGCQFGAGCAGQSDNAVGVGKIYGKFLGCRMTTGAFQAPNGVGGEVHACFNADGSKANFPLPKLTTTERDALSSPPAGIILNTTTGKLNFYTGSGWAAVTSV